MNGSMSNTQTPLSISLFVAVPLRIMEILERDGPSKEDMARAQKASDLLGAKGDLLMFKGKKEGETAKVFNEIAFSIAVLSFCPGGVTVFNTNWDAQNFKERLYRKRSIRKIRRRLE